MKVHQQSIIHFKSDLLAICVESVDELSINHSQFELLRNSLKSHLDIEYSYFLLNEGTNLICPDEHVSLDLQYRGIPTVLFENLFKKQILVEVPHFISEKEEFKDMTHMILLKGQNRNFSVLLIKESEKWKEFVESDFFEDTLMYLANIVQMLRKTNEVRLNENQYRKLYNMTDLFHSTMDINLILENVLNTIQENFPAFHVELILSNDQDRQTSIPIKQFDYLTERPSTIEAFVSGNITTEIVEELNYHLLNAPIKGRQAIYGILQVRAPISYVFSETQKNFIRMLAHASGNALENAKLYHQSHRLISDLQLINETSHRLNMNLDMNEMLKLLQKQLIKSFHPMELCFVFLENSTVKLTDASTDFFKTTEGSKYIDYVSNHFSKTHDSLFIADFNRLITKDVPYKSLMAIPMIVEQRIYGFSIVLHSEAYFFSFDSYKLMQSLIHHSSLAIANSMLRSQLQKMVDHDHLTKLYARSYLDNFVEKSLKTDDSGMFLLIDIDNFKRVNDSYGHHVGDEVLIQIGQLLHTIVGTRGVCARWGGEEMAVYVPNILDDESVRLAKNIVESIPKVTNPTVTTSAGLIVWHMDNRPDFQTIFLQADTALYYSKNNGKNQVYVYDEELEKSL
ncbi:sensor domain-containing diguanylate cyclase [Ureibacillus manganicus]|uniref:Histidine kinase n=1 Tax=Ureibacillus manganicus DSM 26584 TaxID=1384049 RepID=A0A0A3I4B8_9BACL|nr:sensor domain-containing diguanylate cyclase [Ureibacillus manganicus]KGR77523.1 histidine kinase [Ureibacillus manganicus DSM 26584]